MTSEASTNAEIERLGAGHYVSLTTFRKDGTAVPTPVWASTDGKALFVWTEANAGKIKRLRNSGRVLLAPCDARGRLQGAEVEGTARVLDDPAAIARVETLHKAKYKAQFGFFGLFAKLFRRGGGGHVGIEITVRSEDPSSPSRR